MKMHLLNSHVSYARYVRKLMRISLILHLRVTEKVALEILIVNRRSQTMANGGRWHCFPLRVG